MRSPVHHPAKGSADFRAVAEPRADPLEDVALHRALADEADNADDLRREALSGKERAGRLRGLDDNGTPARYLSPGVLPS